MSSKIHKTLKIEIAKLHSRMNILRSAINNAFENNEISTPNSFESFKDAVVLETTISVFCLDVEQLNGTKPIKRIGSPDYIYNEWPEHELIETLKAEHENLHRSVNGHSFDNEDQKLGKRAAIDVINKVLRKSNVSFNQTY